MLKKGAGKPFVILFVLMAICCMYFWGTSRYPELTGKAMMGDHPSLSSLGFAPKIIITDDFTFAEKVYAETVNWIHTNKRGMSFAFVVGTFLLCLLPLLKSRSFKSGFGNSIFGMALGAPLGLCVNCSAPVARSLHAGGASLQTSLAALIASPTFNIVVLTMAFSMFPFYAIVLKIFLTIFFILVLIPLGCKYLFTKEVKKQHDIEIGNNKSKSSEIDINGWGGALIWVVKSYFKNFLYLLKIALPLMLLSGFLGAVLVVLSPWSMVQNMQQDLPLFITILILFIIAVFGTFLPSPMAFDVILSASLLRAGVPIEYVTVLLFTLGSFSIYAFLIVWRAISLRVAGFLFLSTIFLGIFMGIVSMWLDELTIKDVKQSVENSTKTLILDSKNKIDDDVRHGVEGSNFDKATSENGYDPITNRNDTAYKYKEISSELDANKIKYEPISSEKIILNNDNLDIKWLDLSSKSKNGEELFTNIETKNMGMEQPYNISYVTALSDLIPLYTMSVAVGDVHKDGWPDILLTGDLEVRPNLILYSNMGGDSFKRQYLPIPDDINEVVLVALSDLNADTWVDVVFATYNGPRYVIFNEEGEFLEENIYILDDTSSGTTMSIAIDDIEGDGNLDMFFGNWSVGPRFIDFEKSRNVLLKVDKNGIKKHEMSGITGETLTTMFIDFNDDGLQDIYIGNDFMQGDYSDSIFLGQETGTLEPIKGQSGIKNLKGAQSTMSIDMADIDNNSTSDYYIGQIAYLGQSLNDVSKLVDTQIRYDDFCDKHLYTKDKEQCVKETSYKEALAKSANFVSDACQNLKDKKTKDMCQTHLLAYKYFCDVGKDRGIVTGIKVNISKRYLDFCNLRDLAQIKKSPEYRPENLLKIDSRSEQNLLLINKNNGIGSSESNLVNEAMARNVAYGAWTWNARFADLDNDQWQDLYIVNGVANSLQLASNLFYKNKGNGFFEDLTKQSGLEDYLVTSAFSYADFDNDGDLDIVTIPTDAPIQFYKNNTQNSSIQFVLQDVSSRNTQAIGAQVTIFYKEDGAEKKQTQWLKMGGGFKSYNQMLLNFGMKGVQKVDKVIIKWRDGTESVIEGELKVNKRYKIIKS
jgi:uncharacterized membrane protein YraQ (UPF0718 family)